MGNKVKFIIIILIFIIISIVGYLSFRAKDISNISLNKAKNINNEKVENEYKIEMQDVFGQLAATLDAEEIDESNLVIIKERLLKITVPKKEYHDLHMNIFLIVNKFLSEGKNSDRKQVENAKIEMAKLKENNSWISSN